jgi:four helix bundle protein
VTYDLVAALTNWPEPTRASHRSLTAWQEAMKMAAMIYRYSARFPKEEMFGLIFQIRKAAVSVPSNIAEGAARNSTKELLQFIGVASGSLAEVETQIELASILGYMGHDTECARQISRVGKLLVGLRNSLRHKL